MKIALTVQDGHLHENFGRCREFELLVLDAERKRVLHAENASSPARTGLVPRWLRLQGVQLLITGGIGPRALDLCGRCGIAVRAGTGGAGVKQTIADYLDGKLAGVPAGEPRPHDYPL